MNLLKINGLIFPIIICSVLGFLSRTLKAEQVTEFVIAQSWDGVALVESEQARVEVSWLENGDLSIELDAPFADDPKPDCLKAACWELWNYEVVELFLVGAGEPAPYTEIEISPWGNYLVLQLLGTRNVIAKELPLKIVSLERGETRWAAKAVVSKGLLPKGELRVNAYRISGVEPNRYYHVMTPMVGPVPDFHHIDQFQSVLKRQL
jgi:hypothetical protein